MAEIVSLQLRMTNEEREMIKRDAKSMGMTPAKYVVMVCGIVNETARAVATREFAETLTNTLLKSVNNREK